MYLKFLKVGGNILEFLIGIESIHLLEQHYLKYDLNYFFTDFCDVQLQLSPSTPITLPLLYSPLPHTFNPPVPHCGPLYMFLNLLFPLLSSFIPLSHPLWLLSICSLFLCFGFYFACLFVLLITFHL